MLNLILIKASFLQVVSRRRSAVLSVLLQDPFTEKSEDAIVFQAGLANRITNLGTLRINHDGVNHSCRLIRFMLMPFFV